MRLLTTPLPIPNPVGPPPGGAGGQQHPPEWHSPVPYLFGGLAAMLGLIAFALLILACSYWKLSGYLEDSNDPESGGGGGAGGQVAASASAGWEKNVLVIMAGQVMPTFLATPSTRTSRSSSFDSNSTSCSGSVESCDSNKGEKLFVELPAAE